ncbi:site-specific integrase [Mesorhizobium sp.]|uniref:tyrosine-type recombinase/integrase n=1 Tax=Mesorhizobium sp. TaxID=1871066 RepID=UPI000FE8597F|nr:site-specific integrase [Mesorhizobium sp.]RWP80472.1 MAG: site-specific integrase [Mesorhizobium sp.]
MASVLTAKAVEAAKPDGSKRIEKPDAALPGLYLVIQPSGARSWALRFRRNGKPAKLTIGPVLDRRDDAPPESLPLGQAHTLTEARAAARQALQALAEGKDPAGDRKAKLAAAKADPERDLVKKLGTAFIDRYCKRHNRRWQEVERQFAAEINPKWGAKRAQDINKRDVNDLLDGIVDRGSPVTANRVFATLRKFFGWLVERDVLEASPCAGVKKPTAEQSRTRILTDDEIKLFWKAASSFEYPFGPMWRLLLLTGQRREEVAGMTRKELSLDDDKPGWTIPASRAKNGKPHSVPLSLAAVEIIKGLPKIGKAGFLFTTTGETHVTGYSRSKARLDAKMLEALRDGADDPKSVELPGWTLHDLRRTMASGMAKLGINLPVIEKVLNHTSGSFGGIVSVYQHHDFAPEKRAALDAWASFIAALVDDKPAESNVVPMKAAG